MFLKHDVQLEGLRAETLLSIFITSGVFSKHGIEMTVTSVSDGKHRKDSLHYKGAAFDVRIRDIPSALLPMLQAESALRLGNEFDVVLEKDHFHIEYQPKGTSYVKA